MNRRIYYIIQKAKLFLLKIESVGSVDQRINLVLPNKYLLDRSGDFIKDPWTIENKNALGIAKITYFSCNFLSSFFLFVFFNCPRTIHFPLLQFFIMKELLSYS